MLLNSAYYPKLPKSFWILILLSVECFCNTTKLPFEKYNNYNLENFNDW